MKDYTEFNQDQLNNELHFHCAWGNLEVVKYLLTNSELKIHADIHYGNNESFFKACQNGHLEIVRYIIKEATCAKFAQVQTTYFVNRGFQRACQGGHFQVVTYLATNPEVTEAGYPLLILLLTVITVFEWACLNGHLKVVHYLLTSSEVEKFQLVDIHNNKDRGIQWACQGGQLELVKYLLNSPKLVEHADIHAANDQAFCLAHGAHHVDIVHYLIFEHDIKLTPAIQNYLNISTKTSGMKKL